MRLLAAALIMSGAAPAASAPYGSADLLADLGDEAAPRLRGWPGDFKGGVVPLRSARDRASPTDRAKLSRLLGEAHEGLFESAEAQGAYRDALSSNPPAAERAAAQLGLARTLAVADPAGAAALLGTFIAENPASPGAAAAAKQLMARMAMTAGDPRTASTLLRAAIGEAGRDQGRDAPAMVQSLLADLGIALAQSGDFESAANFTAASGVGNDINRGYIPEFRAPLCDPSAGLTDQDAAIFEVAVYNGSPIRITPVWSKRPGAGTAVAMLGRAIAEWRWPIRPPPAVLRHGLRLLLACSDNGDVIVDINRLTNDMSVLDWLDSRNIPRKRNAPGTPEEKFAADVVALAAAEAEHGEQSLQVLPWLYALALDEHLPIETARGHMQRIVSILDASGAPPDVSLMFRVGASVLPGEYETETAAIIAAREFPGIIANYPASGRDKPRLLALRYMTANAQRRTGDAEAAAAGYRSLISLPRERLATDDPLRRSATVLLADIEDEMGHHAAADRLRRDAGFVTISCSKADEKVVVQGLSIEDDRFPPVMRRSDIDGFVVVERQVAGDGHTAGTRIIYASPPVQFDKVSKDAFIGTRSNAPRRAGKAFPCTGGRQPIFWRLEDLQRPE